MPTERDATMSGRVESAPAQDAETGAPKPRHTYDYDVDPASATAPAHAVRLVGRGKRVLEIGCGPGAIAKILATQSQCEVTGLERDLEAIELVKPYCRRVLHADLDSAGWLDMARAAGEFDVVLAADVLEHLYDPWTTLERMKQLIRADGCLVVSLPHAGHAAVLSCLIAGDFEYREWGLLDRTHIRFFGFKNMEEMFSRAGLKIIDAAYVAKTAEETEFAATWSGLTARMQEALAEAPYSQVYQVVVKAVLADAPGQVVPLRPPLLQRGRKADAAKAALGARLRDKMPRRLKQLVKRGLGGLGVSI